MDWSLVFKAVAALSGIGVLSVALLATAARKFQVEVDPNVERVLAALPGGNCGACGNPSCFVAAEGIAAGRLAVNTCVAGGKHTADAIAEILGQESAFVTVVSARHCGGGVNARKAYEYAGLRSCASVSRLAGGSVACAYGCFGLGDCAHACPFGAITMDERGLPVIDAALCTGCGICVRECPRGILQLVPDATPVVVRCASRDSAKVRRSVCSMCCIGCKKCEKECPTGAITVVDGLAVLDPALCIGCYTCVAVCPQDCIDVLPGRESVLAGRTDGRASGFDGFAVDDAGVARAKDAAMSSPEADAS